MVIIYLKSRYLNVNQLMDYKKIYTSLVTSRQLFDRQKTKDGEYFERHHITPRCLSGTNEKENIVLLTAKEHFVAHMLLTKCYEGEAKKKMIFALMGMCRISKYNTGRIVSSSQYEYAREEYSLLMSETSNGISLIKKYGEERAQEINNKRSESLKNFHSNKRKDPIWVKNKNEKKKKKREERKIHGQLAQKEKVEKYGSYSPTEETRQKMREAHLLKETNMSEEEKEIRREKMLERYRNLSEEKKEKRRKKAKEVWGNMSDEKKEARNKKIRDKRVNQIMPKGKKRGPRSQESIEKQKETRKRHGPYIVSEETRKKISEIRKKEMANMSPEERRIFQTRRKKEN